MITNLYTDGFNIYYLTLKDTPFRWLDLRKLGETLFSEDTINKICYFTARLHARPDKPGQAQRQLIYLRALETTAGLEVHYGTFRSGVKRRPLVEPVPGLPTRVPGKDSEEKGTDVNLATRLPVDGFNEVYGQAGPLSNDADFAGAMRYVRDDLRLRVVGWSSGGSPGGPQLAAFGGCLRYSTADPFRLVSESAPNRDSLPGLVGNQTRIHATR